MKSRFDSVSVTVEGIKSQMNSMSFEYCYLENLCVYLFGNSSNSSNSYLSYVYKETYTKNTMCSPTCIRFFASVTRYLLPASVVCHA